MSTITKAEIEALIVDIFDAPAEKLNAIASGHMSKTFDFQIGSKEYIIRFINSDMAHGYYKDDFAYKHFASAQLPIPRVMKIAKYGELHYAISDKLEGQELSAQSPADYTKTIPSILQSLHAIHQADVSRWHGYGYFDAEGNGDTESWAGFHKQIIEETPESAFYGKWHRLFETSFLDRTFFEMAYQKMVTLLRFCPEKRYLLHGDFGYNNVLSQNGKVTAVFDWGNAKYGDFVSDIAYITFWKPDNELLDAAEAYYRAVGMPMEYFAERLLCYKLYMGLDGLRFYAKIGDEQGYQAGCERINALLRT